jgi:hypothetical protein
VDAGGPTRPRYTRDEDTSIPDRFAATTAAATAPRLDGARGRIRKADELPGTTRGYKGTAVLTSDTNRVAKRVALKELHKLAWEACCEWRDVTNIVPVKGSSTFIPDALGNEHRAGVRSEAAVTRGMRSPQNKEPSHVSLVPLNPVG